MRTRDSLISIVALVLALGASTGVAYSDEYTQVLHAESVGFDELAHGMFGGLKAAPCDEVAAK